MLRRTSRILCVVMAMAACALTGVSQSNLTAKATAFETPSTNVVESDRSRDGLLGPVRRVRTEVAKITSETGRTLEGKHAVLEIVAYDLKGSKTENQYFPIAGANLTGKEVYKYDDKGNISEMTLLNTDGSLITKEVYKYEFDFAGNWNKMTTSVAVIEGGRMSFEPAEVTYRFIMYYLDENMMKMAQAAPSTSPSAVPSTGTSNLTLDPKAPANSGQPKSSAAKTSTALPLSTVNPEQLRRLGSTEGAVVKANGSVQSSTVQLESEPPPPPTPHRILKPVSGGVLNGTAISLPSPQYPESARRLRVSGLVTVEVVVDETGKVISAQATSGPGTLRDVASQAALRARFSPTKLSGQPVKVSGLINYKFALAQ